jgi:hypothetical protein
MLTFIDTHSIKYCHRHSDTLFGIGWVLHPYLGGILSPLIRDFVSTEAPVPCEPIWRPVERWLRLQLDQNRIIHVSNCF